MLHRCGVHRRTAFVTDIEGDLSYFLRYAELSKVIEYHNGTLSFRDSTSHFVYGGDAFDHGDDISFAKALLKFYDAYPTRVHLILGNRDINKMVFGKVTERALKEAKMKPELAQHMVFPVCLASSTSRKRWQNYAEYLEMIGMPLITTKTTFLQWALSHKMGATRTFEFRKKELERLNTEKVSDEKVAQSFIDASHPNGVYYEYLKRGKIADIVNGVLFVHGNVSEENIGFVPERKAFDNSTTQIKGHNIMEEKGTTEEWVSALNDFKQDEFKQWESGGDGMLLRQYAFPVSIAPYSVIVQPLVGFNGPQYLGLDAVEFLNRSGVSTLCGGHQPAGDTPCVVQQPGFISIGADNSYSAGDGTRGGSVVEVLLEDDGSIYIHGTRADNTPFSFLANDKFIGRYLGEGWWVKLKLGDGKYEIQRTNDSYRSKEVKICDEKEVEMRLKQWSEPPVRGEAPVRWSKQELT